MFCLTILILSSYPKFVGSSCREEARIISRPGEICLMILGFTCNFAYQRLIGRDWQLWDFFFFFHHKDSPAVCYLRDRSLLANIPSVCSFPTASQNQTRSRRLPPPAGIHSFGFKQWIEDLHFRLCPSVLRGVFVAACCLFVCLYCSC